jgi:hypothetical protein
MVLLIIYEVVFLSLFLCYELKQYFDTCQDFLIQTVLFQGYINLVLLIFAFLKFYLQDVLCFNPDITPLILFCIINALCRFVVEPQEIIPDCNSD